MVFISNNAVTLNSNFPIENKNKNKTKQKTKQEKVAYK